MSLLECASCSRDARTADVLMVVVTEARYNRQQTANVKNCSKICLEMSGFRSFYIVEHVVNDAGISCIVATRILSGPTGRKNTASLLL